MRKYIFFIFLAVLGIFTACGEGEKRKEDQFNERKRNTHNDSLRVTLTKVWSTDTTQLVTPEAATYGKNEKVFYISNLNRDNNINNDGFLSIVNLDGLLREKVWVSGLISPLGNDSFQDHLYVNDKKDIVKINIKTGEIIKRIRIEEATSLNGMDIDSKGNIYVADSGGNKIFKVNQSNKILLFFSGKELATPNGVLVKENKLIVASSSGNSLKSINLDTKKLETLVEGIGQADGIILLQGGHYLTSSWTGEIYFITRDFRKIKILDTKEQKINAADIAFVPEENLLIVPTFYDNRLVAYKLNIKNGKKRY